jgi:hypothetical protein
MACFDVLVYFVGVFWDVPQGNTSGGNSQSNDDELKGNSALDIHLELPIMAYLRVGEVPMGLTPKEQDQIVHKVKQFQCKGNSLLRVWTDGRIRVVPCL